MVQTLSESSGSAVDPRRDVGKVADSEISVPPAAAASSSRPFSRPGSRSWLPVVAPNPNREEGAIISYLDNYLQNPAPQQAAEVETEDGVPIDFTALERGGDDAFTAELKRRTAGMESREQLFRFIEGLGGEWLNRKRMCVDAKEFSDVLPAGWKVVVAIKPSREGRTVPYFYRYISPSGEQFPSCKEVARFLQSRFLSLPTHQSVAAVLPGEDEDDDDWVNYCTAIVPYHHDAAALREEEEEERDGVRGAIVPYIAPESHGEEILPEGTEIPAAIQIHGKYYCEICDVRFDERTEFARHRRFHRKTRSGYRNRPPLTDGVIMKDGKYGCQFCHKVFDRKISYTGHVGIHLRRNLKFSTLANMAAETSGSVEAAPMAAITYYGKDPRRGAGGIRHRPHSRPGLANLILLSEVSARDEEEELANLRLLSEVSERLLS